MKRLRTLVVLCGCALLLSLGVTAGAQEVTSTIVGTVVDSSGAVIPGATVKLTDAGTGAVRTASTGQGGIFRFPNLGPHTYQATVTANGFQAKNITNIVLAASSTRDLGRITMAVGNVSQEVTVTAAASPIQTASSAVNHTIQGSALDSLPLVGRDMLGAMKLDAGVVASANYDAVGAEALYSITIDGNTSAKNFTVDGVTDMDTGSNAISDYAPNEDAIQEVKILSSNYDAQYGVNSGGTIIVTTKSGTNKFHGSLWANHRHEEFNANSFFNNARGALRPRYRYNIAGWSFGGPVALGWLKDRLYFFGSQEYTNQATSPGLQDSIVPTAAERAGKFDDSINPKTGQRYTVIDPLTHAAFPGNQMPAESAANAALCGVTMTCINPTGQAMLNFFPQPNYTGAGPTLGDNYQTQASAPHPVRNDVLRIDFNPTSKLTSFFRWINDHNNAETLFVGQPFNIGGLINANSGHGYAWSATYVISPTLINTATVGKSWNTWSWNWLPGAQAQVSRTATLDPPTLFPLPTTPAGVNGYTNLLPVFSFGSNRVGSMTHAGSGFSNVVYNYFNDNPVWTVDDDLSKIAGAHQLKTGIYIERQIKLQPSTNSYAGNYSFATDANNPLNTGDGFANALAGYYDTYSQATARDTFNATYWNVEFYAQDSWHATRKLNLDLGVRFYHQTPQIDTNNTFSEFVPSLYTNQATGSFSKGILYTPGCTVAMTAPGNCAANGGKVIAVDPNGHLAPGPAAYIGAYLPGINPANGMVQVGKNGVSPDPYTTKYLAVAPRIGFAYDVFGDGKTALRGGFGVFYNRLDGNQVYGMSGQAPNSYTYTVTQGMMANLAAQTPPIAPSTISYFSGKTPLPVVKNASFGVEHELGYQTALDVSYVGNWSTDQNLVANANPVPLGADFESGNFSQATGTANIQDNSALERTRYPGMVDLNQEAFFGHSNYNSLQVTLEHRLVKGVLFGAAYTWSRSLGVTTYDPLMAAGDGSYQNNDARNYGLLSNNRDQVLVVNYSWALPGVGNKLAGAVLNHWTYSGLVTMTSGAPYTPGFINFTGTDYTGSVNETARLVQTGNALANVPAGDIFNPNAFMVPVQSPSNPTVELGNVGSNPLTMPGYWDADMTVQKFIPVGFNEGSGISIQVQAYNVFNHPQFVGYGTNINLGGAAAPSSTNEARILSFNLRYTF